jgi:hypothetical protein
VPSLGSDVMQATILFVAVLTLITFLYVLSNILETVPEKSTDLN